MKIALSERLKNAVRSIKGTSQPVFLEYAVNPIPRFGHGKPPQPVFLEMFETRTSAFGQITDAILDLEALFAEIAAGPADALPRFRNGWIPALDAFLLCHFVHHRRPRSYLEIGSGNSTAFVKRCITKYSLPTSITSIDPQPRRGIDELCDHVIRSGLENTDLDVFSGLQSGDVIFVDNSHRCFPNSDCTVFMMEVMPQLPPGLLVGLHDIFLPDDYLPFQAARFYSEQYLLACYMLGGFVGFDVVYPAWYEYYYGTAANKLAPLYQTLNLRDGPDSVRHGCSFWFETTGPTPPQ